MKKSIIITLLVVFATSILSANQKNWLDLKRFKKGMTVSDVEKIDGVKLQLSNQREHFARIFKKGIDQIHSSYGEIHESKPLSFVYGGSVCWIVYVFDEGNGKKLSRVSIYAPWMLYEKLLKTISKAYGPITGKRADGALSWKLGVNFVVLKRSESLKEVDLWILL